LETGVKNKRGGGQKCFLKLFCFSSDKNSVNERAPFPRVSFSKATNNESVALTEYISLKKTEEGG